MNPLSKALAYWAIILGFVAGASAADKPLVLDVWPGKVPGETGKIDAEKIVEPKAGEKSTVKQITNVTQPTLTVFRSEKEKDCGVAVVIAPGGGYNILAWDLEGEEVAAWLNTLGVTGIVLKYRVPRRPDDPKNIFPQQDAQRAVSLVRSKAQEWGLDPKRIGMLGFSAGGHLTAMTAANFDKRTYEPIDDVDKVSCRPDFAVLIYPGGLLEKGKDQLVPELRISKEYPPTFLAHAGNDGVSPQNSVQLFLALKKAGVPAEMHIYADGGHGFGLRPSAKPCSTWPKRCVEWLRNQGVLK